ncbi:MAG: hypothetical protein CM1200mP10_27500 [Candidatus Neomarinimicrobiota bacterium]|nr:MAG: hypothetical protein CM1200mP10_27500 [Candidatus Neomarinimicrobiota bacterium]
MDGNEDLDAGVVENITENLTTSFNPVIFSWLKPNFNYLRVQLESGRQSTLEGANIGTQLRFSSNTSLNLVNMFEVIYKPPSKTAAPQEDHDEGIRNLD